MGMHTPLRVLVTGSRDWKDREFIRNILGGYTNYDVTLVSGACPDGADDICENVADEFGWWVERHPADWARLGKRAGFVRNSEMVKMGADICLAFIKDNSKGATMTRDLALREGIKTETYIHPEPPSLPPWLERLRPHQLEALERLGNGKILWGGVGSGKTPVAVAYSLEREATRDIYVITTAKKRDDLDWDTEFARHGIGTRSDATVAGTLHVDSWNNIGKYTKVYGAFFIFDEQRLVGSGAWTKAFLQIAKRNHWILLSATPGDTWLDYIPVFVANGFYKNRTDFKDQHVIYSRFTKFPKVDRYIGVGKLLRHKRELLVPMPYLRHTKRHLVDVAVEFDKERFEKVWKDRWNVFEDRPLKNITETFTAARKVVNSDLSRLRAVESLMQKHPRLIVFYNFDYELNLLRSLASQVSPSINTHILTSITTTRPLKNGVTAQIAEIEGDEWLTNRSTKSGLNSASNSSQESSIFQSNSSGNQTLSYLSNSSSGGMHNSPLFEPPSQQDLNGISTMSSDCGGDDLQIAEWNGHKHQPIPTSERWLYLVQYVAGAEGWNCVETNATVFFSLPYSYKVWEQAHGRIDRLNTSYTDLYYYALKSNSFIDRAVEKTLREKKSFNEARFLSSLNYDQPKAKPTNVGHNVGN